MSSSISSATSQQQFVQVQQAAAKTYTVKGDASSKAEAQSAQVAQAQAVPTQIGNSVPAPASANSIPVSKFHRNDDGSYGPGHTVLPPYNPLKPSTNDSADAQSLDSAAVSVNVKI